MCPHDYPVNSAYASYANYYLRRPVVRRCCLGHVIVRLNLPLVKSVCAAPGSKTFQLLEMIHKEDKPGLLPQGMVGPWTIFLCLVLRVVVSYDKVYFVNFFGNWKCYIFGYIERDSSLGLTGHPVFHVQVIANDLDVQRCHLLIHQTKRMCSPNILVTNHEGQHFPGLKEKGNHGRRQAQRNGSDITDDENGLMFDRILCDVPCSGDGTIRKAPDIWKKW